MTRTLIALAVLSTTACSKPTVLEGKVTDVWGTPIQGAMVQVEGLVDITKSDNSGVFKFELDEGLDTYRLQAGKDGYIPSVTSVGAEGDEGPGAAKLELYPEPKQPGFYAVAKTGYEHLIAEKIRTVGSDVEAYTGLPDEGEAHLYPKGKETFVFSSTLKSSELSRLNLQLHRLKYVDSTEVPGVLGDAQVRVNLWVAEDKMEFDLKGLPRENTYLISVRDPLDKGVYAFSTQEVLASEDPAALDKLPKEMRVAYPFRTR